MTERLRFGAALMLVITYSITVGGLLLPIGSPPNLIGRDLLESETGEPITFVEWFGMALPIVCGAPVSVTRNGRLIRSSAYVTVIEALRPPSAPTAAVHVVPDPATG